MVRSTYDNYRRLNNHRCHHRYLELIHLQGEPSTLDLADAMLGRHCAAQRQNVPECLLDHLFYSSQLLRVPSDKILMGMTIARVSVDDRRFEFALRTSGCDAFAIFFAWD